MSTTRVPAHAIRGLSADDSMHVRSHMARLGSDGLWARFGYRVSDRFLDAYAERCVSPNAIAYGYFEAGTMRGLGEMHLTSDWPQRVGELAFSVEGRWRRYGIATRLIRHLLLAARNGHVEHLMLQCAANNGAMLAMARRHASDLTFEEGVVTGHLRIGRPSLSSRFHAVFDLGFFRAPADAPSTHVSLRA